MLMTVLLAVGLLALAFAGIAVKILMKKNGQFAGTCASNNPLVQREGGTCGYCGAKPSEQCRSNEVSA
ncbi:MAG: membrane or secreted protein [Flavobacteriales bacterium]|nr:membrane or secreted protein [Flavobacteriales bacterium]